VNVPDDIAVHIVPVASLSIVELDVDEMVVPPAPSVSVCEVTVMVSCAPPSSVTVHDSPAEAVAVSPDTV
jgi:hypothetical protein